MGNKYFTYNSNIGHGRNSEKHSLSKRDKFILKKLERLDEIDKSSKEK